LLTGQGNDLLTMTAINAKIIVNVAIVSPDLSALFSMNERRTQARMLGQRSHHD